jgi:hypothetical protein
MQPLKPRGIPVASIHLIADKESSRKPVCSLMSPYPLGPGLWAVSSPLGIQRFHKMLCP